MAVGVNFIKNISEKYICECYIMDRQKAVPHDSLTVPNTQSGEFVYSDLIESLSSTNFNDCRYFMTFKNNFIFYSKVYCIHHKSEIFAIFLRFKTYLKSLGFRICHIRLDNRKEYMSKTFLAYLAQCGIKQELTVSNNPQMNNAAKRFGQTLLNKIHPILLSSKLNKSFWSEIVIISNYLTMRSPDIRIIFTPFEAFYHRKLILFHLRIIDFIAYALKRI